MEYWSHPNYLLKNHIQDVVSQIQDIAMNKDINYFMLDTTKEELLHILTFVALTHDVGKYSDFFQLHLRNGDWECSNYVKKEFERNHQLSYHSLISGIVLLTILEYFYQHNDNVSDSIIYSAVSSIILHHSSIKPNSFLKDYKSKIETIENLKIINNHINYEEYCQLLKIYFPSSESIHFDANTLQSKVNLTIETFILKLKAKLILNSQKTIVDHLLKYKAKNNEAFLFIYIYSCLIYSDKYSAIFRQQNNRKNIIFDKNIVDKYKKQKGFKSDTKLNIEREEVYLNVCDQIHYVNLANKILNLTMNTGYGKTLTSLNFAIQLQNRLFNETGYHYKIIYAMPFTSIIEQNFEVLQNVLKTEYQNITSDILLKHHHLSPVEYKNNQDEYETNESKFLIETWDSNIIFTTFVQFFELFFTTENKRMCKFPNLINSIIVIDEIQSLSEKYYKCFQLLFEKISKIFNIYTIYSSATQPYIISETCSLLPNYEDYYQSERTKMILDPKLILPNYQDTVITMSQFKVKLNNIIMNAKNKNKLIIMNTKKSAYQIYEYCRNEFTDNEVILLSNSMIGKHKLEKIEEVKEKMKNKNIILVSTQLIEAGVDLDFDIGIRDFAPLPNLLQSAGRVNRNFLFGDFYGEFYVFNIDGLCQYVYDYNLLQYTHNCLKTMNLEIIEEPLYLQLNKLYFNEMKLKLSESEGKKLLQSLYDMQFQYSITKNDKDEFKLIEENKNEITLYVKYDQNAIELYERYSALQFKSKIEAQNEFLKFKSEFLEYTMKVSKFAIDKLFKEYGIQNENSTYYILPIEFCGESDGLLYSKEQGLKIYHDIENNI